VIIAATCFGVALLVVGFIILGTAPSDTIRTPKTPNQPTPNTVDAVVAWEIVRARLSTNGMNANDLLPLDQTIAPKLFPAKSP
jgi:hypothetical protein